MIHDTQSAQISQKQDEHNIYAIMKTMCPPGYHQNGFVATHALGYHVPKCMSCHKVTVVITRSAHCFPNYTHINYISPFIHSPSVKSVFDKSKDLYNNALSSSAFKDKIKFNSDLNKKITINKCRKRMFIWFNPHI